jgi:HAD superfamily hydrolase (TIGR01458 family)
VILRGPLQPGAMCDDPRMTPSSVPNPGLRAQLAGVRGLLLDMDGVLVLRNALIPGAAGALASLDGAGIPYLVATNTSMVSRATLSRELARAGLAIPPERIISAASAAAAYTRRHFAAEPLYVMVAPDARVEFEGLRLLSHDEAAEVGARAAALVVGDAGDEFTPRNVQTAFTLLRGGARFVAMHKNRWWITPAGVMLDSGGYVAALEFATQKRALVTGKPSRAFFAEGVRQLGGLAAGRLAPGEVAMVGDDLWNDIRGAQRAGLRGVFVRSGKHGDAELERATAERGGRAPDAVAPSIVEIAEALAGTRVRSR